MRYFDFPTWAQDKLGGNKPQAEPVKQMPRPTLDEIDAMVDAKVTAMEQSAPKKRGRPAKVKP